MAFTPLTRRLFPAEAELELRAALAGDRALLDHSLTELLHSASGWQPLRDFLLSTVADRVPTLVYGDYDVDGSTSAFLLFRWLRAQRVPANYFLPSRFKHGYGLDSGVIEQAVSQGYKRLLAVDCGTANLTEIAAARAGGLEVAVVDHHTCKDELPDALLLNPHIDTMLPPLCTAGLVYAILTALRIDEGIDLDHGDELVLAGLATVADIVPLVPLSWALAHHALELLPTCPNHGVSELIKISRLHGLRRLTGRQLGFDLIPRLNAAGRMAQARVIAELLLADQRGAREYAAKLEQLNQQRKDTARQITEQANAQALLYAEQRALVLHGADWHPGVLGIVAARVAEQHGKPVAILADAPGEPEMWSGSVRSFGGVDIVAALNDCSAHLFSFGGHAQAAGLKVSRDGLETFRTAWHEAVECVLEKLAADGGGEPERVPVDATLAELTAQFESDLWLLAPFGPQHPSPRLRLGGVRVVRCDFMGAARTHMALHLSDGERQARVAGFNMSHLVHRLKPGDKIDAVVEVEPDNWNNTDGIMLRLIEIAGAND